jgi:tRNA(Ile2) C34 agmatinyltransferase TiaS
MWRGRGLFGGVGGARAVVGVGTVIYVTEVMTDRKMKSWYRNRNKGKSY